MPRKLRLEFPAAYYHVINCGNHRADMKRRFQLFLAMLGAGVALFAEGIGTAAAQTSPLPSASPAEAGLSAERLQRVTAFLDRLQGEGKIAGAVFAVARRGKLVVTEARGLR